MARDGQKGLAAAAGLALLGSTLGVGYYHGAISADRHAYVADAGHPPTGCEVIRSRGDSELCALWRSTFAAEEGARWTFWGLVVGAAGSALLLWQIALTRKAVRDTSAATVAMLEANEIARANARGYLAPIIEANWKDGEYKRPVVSVINIGKADCLLTYFSWGWSDELPAKEDSLIIHGPPRAETVLAGKTVELGFVRGNRPYSETEYLIGVFRYRTMLQTDQRSYFVYRIRDGLAIDVKPEDWFADT